MKIKLNFSKFLVKFLPPRWNIFSWKPARYSVLNVFGQSLHTKTFFSIGWNDSMWDLWFFSVASTFPQFSHSNFRPRWIVLCRLKSRLCLKDFWQTLQMKTFSPESSIASTFGKIEVSFGSSLYSKLSVTSVFSTFIVSAVSWNNSYFSL